MCSISFFCVYVCVHHVTTLVAIQLSMMHTKGIDLIVFIIHKGSFFL